MTASPAVCYGVTPAEVEVGVKSKRIMAEGLPPEVAEEDGVANCHWRAAFRAAAAKNWLGAGFASSAAETVPSGVICTRTLMRTVPRMVERAFSETTGRTLRWMEGAAGFTFAGA